MCGAGRLHVICHRNMDGALPPMNGGVSAGTNDQRRSTGSINDDVTIREVRAAAKAKAARQGFQNVCDEVLAEARRDQAAERARATRGASAPPFRGAGTWLATRLASICRDAIDSVSICLAADGYHIDTFRCHHQ